MMVLTAQNRYVDLLERAGVSSVAVGGASGSVWSWNFVLPKNNSFGFEIGVGGSGTVNVDVYLEQSTEQLTDAEQALTNSDYVVPKDESPIITLEAVQVENAPVAPVVNLFGRLKFVKATGNDASIVINKLRLLLTENA